MTRKLAILGLILIAFWLLGFVDASHEVSQVTQAFPAEARGKTAIVDERLDSQRELVNGDFSIFPSENEDALVTLLGDGINEVTKWIFDFGQAFDSWILQPELLARVRLLITLERKGGQHTSPDDLWIEGIPKFSIPIPPEHIEVPVDRLKTITLDLLEYYTKEEILDVLQKNNSRFIPMRFQDDAIISYAKIIMYFKFCDIFRMTVLGYTISIEGYFPLSIYDDTEIYIKSANEFPIESGLYEDAIIVSGY